MKSGYICLFAFSQEGIFWGSLLIFTIFSSVWNVKSKHGDRDGTHTQDNERVAVHS